MAHWFRRLRARDRGRTTGFPTSSNRASSFHLHWLGLPDEPLMAAAVTLEVIDPPAVPRLYFWALQASFEDRGRRYGAAHLGLQWHSGHPGSTAVNFGGYAAGGGELAGSTSPLPSATGNPNTRDLVWEAGHPYRLVIGLGDEPGTWRGSVDDRPVRDLSAGGTELGALMVWSEVFARCDDPPVTVRWSDFEAITDGGVPARPDRLRVTYQSRGDGGCDNTTVEAEGDAVLQRTGVSREVRHGTVLALTDRRA